MPIGAARSSGLAGGRDDVDGDTRGNGTASLLAGLAVGTDVTSDRVRRRATTYSSQVIRRPLRALPTASPTTRQTLTLAGSVALAALSLAVLAPATAVVPAPSEAAPSAVPAATGARRVADDPQVLAISIDALNPAALRKVGHSGAPNLWRLVDEGASTLNARSQVELTVTLPNHTSMVTGRRIDARSGGHGVTWNDDNPGRPTTVQAAAGHGVASVFSVAHGAGRTTALYAAKTKFSLFASSWPRGIDRVAIREERDGSLVKAVRKDLVATDRDFTFLHLGNLDKTGHAKGFMGPDYLAAVRRMDALVGRILTDAETKPALRDLTIILTADHGGSRHSTSHSDNRLLANFRVPFVVWGPGVAPADLYSLNPDYRDPGTRRVGVAAAKQPVRNGNVADLALDLLGVKAVPGSIWGKKHPLLVR